MFKLGWEVRIPDFLSLFWASKALLLQLWTTGQLYMPKTISWSLKKSKNPFFVFKFSRGSSSMCYIRVRGIGCKNVVVMALLVIATALPEKVTNLNIWKRSRVKIIQWDAIQTAHLVNNHYQNEVTLTGQNPPIKCRQSLEIL